MRFQTQLLILATTLTTIASGCTAPTLSDQLNSDLNAALNGTGGFGSSDFFNFLPNILVADRLNGRLVGMDDLTGNNRVQYNLPSGGLPTAFTTDDWERIFIVDGFNSSIVRIDDLTGANAVTYGTPGTGANQFNAPQSISFDGQWRMVVADSGNNRIVRSDDMSGTHFTSFGTLGSGVNQFRFPSTVAVDARDRIYIADSGNNRIVRIDDLTGTNWTTFGTLGNGTNQFNGPLGLSLDFNYDNSGNAIVKAVLIADTGNNRIVQINDLAGAGWTTLGAAGGSAGSGTNQFHAPGALNIVDGWALYISDTGNNRIVQVDDITGLNFTAFGSTGAGLNQFNSPLGIIGL